MQGDNIFIINSGGEIFEGNSIETIKKKKEGYRNGCSSLLLENFNDIIYLGSGEETTLQWTRDIKQVPNVTNNPEGLTTMIKVN